MQVLRWGMMQLLAMGMQLLCNLTLCTTLQRRSLLRLHQVGFLHPLPSRCSTARSAAQCSTGFQRLSHYKYHVECGNQN